MTSLPVAAAFRIGQRAGAALSPDDWAAGGASCLDNGQRLQRSTGAVEVGFKAEGAVTRLERAYQSGCGRIRLPRQHDVPHPTGILINTAGGLTGGDRFSVRATLDAGTRAVLTTQAAEKVYRSAGGEAVVDNAIALGAGARLDWLPQETILFDRSALRRRTTVAMAVDAVLTATELVVFGRAAMGETVATGAVTDAWRIVRDGRLVFADALRLAGPVAPVLAARASAAGATAVALVVHVAADAAGRVEAVRAMMAGCRGVRAGASAFDGLLVARLVAVSGQELRGAVLGVLDVLRDGLPPPRPWLM